MWNTGASTQNIAGLSAGTYTVTVTDLNNCTKSGSAIVGFASPVCTNLAVSGVVSGSECFNATNTITVAEFAPFTVISGSQAELIAGVKIIFKPGATVASGGYLWGHIAPGGPFCGVKSASIVTNPASGSDENSELQPSLFRVFPNPTTGLFTVELNKDFTEGRAQLEIFGMQGEKVFSTVLLQEKKRVISLEGKPNGIYFIRIIASEKSGSAKIIKQ